MKRIIPLCLCALVLFSSFLVPVSAAPLWYDYAGHYFPEVPYVSSSQYPYQFIAKSWVGMFNFVATDVRPTIYVSDNGYYAIGFSTGNVLRCFFDADTYTWGDLHVSTQNNDIALDSPVYIWSNANLYYNNQLFASASQPTPITYPNAPRFSTNLERNKIYTYQLDQVATQLFVQGYSTSGYTVSYLWQTYLNGEWSSIANTSTDSRYFTPPTNVEGTFQYRCLAYYEPFGIKSGFPSNTVYVVVGSGAVPDDSVSVGDQVIIDQISGVQDSINDVKDSIDSVNDSLNATDPALDSSIGDLEDSSAAVDDFEDEQWDNINDNIGDVTGAFDAFKDGSLAASFTFLGGIVNNTFDSLGNWQVVLTLPLALGLILYICSRAPLAQVTRVHDSAQREVDRANKIEKKKGG